MKLLSIHIGKAKKVSHNGKTVTTGIFKNKVEGRLLVTKTGIKGDEQANLKVHGGINKAVYAYPSEHLEFWKQQRRDLEFYPGVFGENLSTSGLSEAEVCVGDIFQIGEVKLSETTPRMPCHKLGIKMKDKAFIKEFLKAERTGFYFKVLKQGEIQAGESIQKVGDDGYGLSVKELVQLHTTRKNDIELLNKAGNSPTLLEEWRSRFTEKIQ